MKIGEETILYEDNIIIAINKPDGLPTQSSENGNKKDLYNQLQYYLNERDKKPVYLALHHRLDAAASGVIIFCKNKYYNKFFTDLFRDKKIKKTYLAVVDIEDDKLLKDKWTIENKLKTYKFRNFKKAQSANKGDLAITHFKLLKRAKENALIECTPETGRLHQIRVHLSECKLPIKGDFHYNKNKSKSGERLMLHAQQISFIHPKTRKLIEITANSPFQLPD